MNQPAMFRQFEPPFDSPLEEVLAWDLSKYISPATTLLKQVVVHTRLGSFRHDFVLVLPSGARVAIECDGSAYHKRSRDRFRDAAILADADIQGIFRFRGRDIIRHSDDLIFLMSRLLPEAFSERGHSSLGTLRSREAAQNYESFDEGLMVQYSDEEQGPFNYIFPSYSGKLLGASDDWRVDVSLIESSPYATLDELAEKFPSPFDI